MLSLDERMRLALNHLTVGLDWRPIVRNTPLWGLPFTHAHMGEHLVMSHAYPDLMECPGRYLTPLAMLLEKHPDYAAGGIKASAAAERQAEYISSKITPEGLFVTPQSELDQINHPDDIFGDYYGSEGSEKLGQMKKTWYGRAGVEYNGHLSIMMEGLIRWHLLTGDRKAKAAIDRAIAGRISDPKSPEIRAGKGMVLPGMMTPLSLYYQATGDAAAKAYLDELADDYVRNIHPKYFPDGLHAHGDGVGHLHCRMGGFAGFARYARIAGRKDYLDAVEHTFAVNLLWGTEFGFLPERHVYCNCGASSDTGHIYQPWVLPGGKTVDFSFFTRPRSGWDTCEICVTADAIDAAIVLAESGYERYWDVAERLTNHLLRIQITDTSILLNRHSAHPREMLGATFENVPQALLGSFSSASTPTSMFIRENYGKVMPDGRDGVREWSYYTVYCACCPGWAARTLGLLWKHAVSESGDRVEVNLPFDRTTSRVSVKSHLPREGRIELKAIQSIDALVRIPDWVEHARVKVTVSGQTRPTEYKNPFSDFVRIGRLQAGQTAEISYPLRQEKKRYYIDYHPCLYEATWLGNTVTNLEEIGIEKPEGEN
ncbi:MAG: hypothetical protein IT440_08185, partial [Phycisphaeraceae bacterium]|nr:hypothetical protein [Phycisphaeraceae bacterium]